MDLGRIKYYLSIVDDEDLSMGEIAEIDAAFRELVASGVVLRDEADNALTRDQLEELGDNATTVERTIYEWVKANFGEAEANDPSWSTFSLAREINNISVGFGEETKLASLLGEDYAVGDNN